MSDPEAEKNGPAPYLVPLREFIQAVGLHDLRRMVYDCKLHYLSFPLTAQFIEFLGACLDELPFEKENQSENRFTTAIRDLFVPINKEYAKHNKRSSEHFLYRGLRSGLTHMVRPTCGIKLTSRKESIEDGTSHLRPDAYKKLILVAEDLYDDLERACNALIRKLDNGKLTAKKLQQPYLSVHSYHKSK